ncbi:amidohydrolase family protein [Halosolutus amylolyticus]|uniref:Amidohydrolase family protein n=1 Tax=Halosolutus amylolyticus TaxID=2932267 RepID=A0ABD5PRA1_9EURY|nr:amidohydrolase family protein [Halosolutus amylolyticus]
MPDYPIVNAHHHIGHPDDDQDSVFQWSESVAQIIDTMDENRVDASMLMPLGGENDRSVTEVHDSIYEASEAYPGRIFGITAPNAHLGREFVHEEITRCVEELDFKYAKLHTLAWGVDPTSDVAYDFYDACVENDIPVMIHTGPHGMPFSVPGMLIPVAEDYPELDIVMAHMGGAYTLTQEAIILAKRYENLYLDTTLALNMYVRRAMEEVGADRLLMAAEHSSNIPVALTKIDCIGASEDQKRQILGGNAIDLYDLDVAVQDWEEKEISAAD